MGVANEISIPFITEHSFCRLLFWDIKCESRGRGEKECVPLITGALSDSWSHPVKSPGLSDTLVWSAILCISASLMCKGLLHSFLKGKSLP